MAGVRSELTSVKTITSSHLKNNMDKEMVIALIIGAIVAIAVHRYHKRKDDE